MSVLEIQQALAAAGFDPGPQDGKLGPRTKAAIRAYQQANGLAVDGIAGPNTQAKLRGGGSTASAAPEAAAQDAYPQFGWLYADAELGPVLRRAAAEGWSDTRLEGEVQKTAWWKTHSEAARSYLQLAATDPAETAVRLNNFDKANEFMRFAASYGVGYTMDDALKQTQRVVRGETSAASLRQEIINQAKGLFPDLAKDIDAGSTVENLWAPYRNIAAQVLGVTAESINLIDPKWQAALMVPDGPNGHRRASTAEWAKMLRTDPTFGFSRSQSGRDTAYEGVNAVFEGFGMEAVA